MILCLLINVIRWLVLFSQVVLVDGEPEIHGFLDRPCQAVNRALRVIFGPLLSPAYYSDGAR
jgi:hypothetical protein